MLFIIYSIYVDAFNFVRKNLLLIIFFLIASLIYIFLDAFDIPPYNIIFFVFNNIFISCFIVVYLIVFIIKSSNFMFIDEPVITVINKYYRKALLVYIIGYFLNYLIVLPVFGLYRSFSTFIRIENLFFLLLLQWFYSFITFATINSPLISMVSKNLKPFEALKFGLNEVRNHSHFYFLIIGVGVVLEIFPSLITPLGIVNAPLVQLAEYNLTQQPNIFLVIFSMFMQISVFVACVYAFLYKNNFHAKIVNPKSEIVN